MKRNRFKAFLFFFISMILAYYVRITSQEDSFSLIRNLRETIGDNPLHFIMGIGVAGGIYVVFGLICTGVLLLVFNFSYFLCRKFHAYWYGYSSNRIDAIFDLKYDDKESKEIADAIQKVFSEVAAGIAFGWPYIYCLIKLIIYIATSASR